MKNLLQQKKIKYATFSVIMTALVIAVILVLNIIVQSLNISFDMTKEKSNSLTNDSIKYIKELDEPITIFALYKTGDVYKPFEEILNEYDRYSNNLTVTFIDPYQNPQFVEQYKTDGEDIPVGSFIVQGQRKFKVVSSTGLIEQGTSITINNLEPRLTNAIIYVSDENTPIIYTIEGHNELELGSTVINALSEANFEVKSLNLQSSDIPDDCALLLLTTPNTDYTTSDVNKITTFLNNGGSAFITADIVMGANKPNYDSILKRYGVQKSGYIAVETDKSKFVENMPINIIPTIEDTDLTNTLIKNSKVLLLPTVTGIVPTEAKSQSVTVTNLLTTTKDSYGKTNPSATTFSFEEGDIRGPLPLAVLVEDSHSLSTEVITKLVVTGTTAIVDDSINSYVGGGNSSFVVASAKYLVGEQDDLYLSPKVIQSNSLTMTFGSQLLIIIYSVVILPLVILIAGAVIFFRRKNR